MAKNARTVLSELTGKRINLYLFGAKLKNLTRVASKNPDTASLIGGYAKKTEEYAQSIQDIQSTVSGLSLNIVNELQGHIDKVADFGQFLLTKPDGSEKSIFQILYMNTKDEQERQKFMEDLHYVDTTLGLGIRFDAPEMSTENLIPEVQELKEENQAENMAENKADDNAKPENEEVKNEEAKNDNPEGELEDEARIDEINADIPNNNENKEIQNENNAIQNENNVIQNENNAIKEPENPDFSDTVLKLNEFKSKINEYRTSELYWSQVSDSIHSSIAELIEAVEGLREAGFKSAEDVHKILLDDLEPEQREAVDNFNTAYIKNKNQLNQAYALLAYDRDLDDKEKVQNSHTNPEYRKAVKQIVEFVDSELSRSQNVMDKVILFNIQTVDMHKVEIGEFFQNGRPPRNALTMLQKRDEETLFEEERERAENAKMAYTRSAAPVISGFASSFGNDFAAEYFNKQIVDDIDINSLDDANLIKETGKYTIDFNGNAQDVHKYPSEKAKNTVQKRIHTVNEDMKRILRNSNATKQEKELISVVYLKAMDRVEKGYPDLYMSYKSPLASLYSNIGADTRTILENHKLDRDMTKWGEKFPIFEYSKKTSEISDTMVDYWEAKKKAGRALSPQKEQEHRIKLYDKVVSAAVLYDRMMFAVEDPETARQIREDDLLGNDPFHIHPLSNRGTKATAVSLDTYKRGLEQGWAIDDLSMLCAFRLISGHLEDNALGNGALAAEDYEVYNPPKWASEETKDFVQKMNNLYEEMISTPLTSAEQRKNYLDRMDAMVTEGIEKNLFKTVMVREGNEVTQNLSKEDYIINYYDQISKQRVVRDVLIEKGKEPAFHPAIDRNRHIETIEARLNTRRTDIKFWSENQEHKDLRIAFAKLKDFIKENPKKERNPEEMKKYARMMMNRLDAVERLSSIYSESHRTASSSGGKERLAGARECGKFAKDQKLLLLSEMKKAGIIEAKSDVNAMRTYLAMDKMTKSMQELEAYDKLPTDPDGRNKVYNLVADIVVGRIAGGSGMNGKKMLEEYGIMGLKEKVAANNEFQSFITECTVKKNISGKQMAELVMGDGIINKIQNIKNNIEAENTNLETTKGPVKPGKIENTIPRNPVMGR